MPQNWGPGGHFRLQPFSGNWQTKKYSVRFGIGGIFRVIDMLELRHLHVISNWPGKATFCPKIAYVISGKTPQKPKYSLSHSIHGHIMIMCDKKKGQGIRSFNRDNSLIIYIFGNFVSF